MRLRLPVGLLLIAVTLSGCGYNRIQELDERTEELKSNIGVELTNRNSLIPNLVATVQGAAEFERGTFSEVAQARAGQLMQAQETLQQAVQSGDVEQMAAAEGAVNGQLRTFINVAVEAYPQLRAQQNFSGPGIRALPLPVPPTPVQRQLNDLLKTRRNLLSGQRTSAEATQDVVTSLFQLAFSAKPVMLDNV